MIIAYLTTIIIDSKSEIPPLKKSLIISTTNYIHTMHMRAFIEPYTVSVLFFLRHLQMLLL